MATVCTECGDEVGTTYDCSDCGEAFCVDCRLPDDHDCDAQIEQDGGSEPGATTATTAESFSLPSGPRIETFLPIWRAVPWQGHALLSLLPLYIGFHIYHERLDSEDGEWMPSLAYYVPILMYVVALRISRNTAAILLLGGIPTLITVIIYAVQKVRHSP